ncbi:hypothetical protein O0L34_g5760 [Tuta absoluta]|nr:hypothetical protein O0L34_g5760 [Tuta absoluta]
MVQEEVKNDFGDTKPVPKVGIRHVQAIMLCFAMAISYAMRVNISLAIVAMTDKSDKESFDWSVQTQSLILSSFFWGYIVLQVPAGMLSAKFGGKFLIIMLVSVNSVVSIILPSAAYYGGWYLVCACRVLQGLSQGFLYPTTHSLLGQWAPLEEKSRLGTLAYSGCQIGMALQLICSGFIAAAWGWPAIFYSNGAVGAMWVVLYVFLGASSPQDSTMISVAEKQYIENSLGHIGVQKKYKIPWKSIWTSIPFLSLMITHGGQNWGFFTMATLIPTYMANVLGADIKQNGVLSALPYFTIFAISFAVGYTADWIIKRKWLSTTNTRKMFNSIGLYGAGLALVGLSYVPPGELKEDVTLLMVAVGINAGNFAGYMLVHIDMAPNFAGTLMGITNCFANIVSLIAPLAAGAMLNDETDPHEWRKVFFTAAGIYFVTNTIFVVFGTSETQQWNEPEDDSTGDNEKDTDPSGRRASTATFVEA